MITASTRIVFQSNQGSIESRTAFLPANEVTQRDLNSIMLPTCFDFQYEGPSVTVGINRHETLCVRCDCVLVSDNSNFKLPFLCRCVSSKQTKNVATDKEEKEIVESKKQGIGVGGTLGCNTATDSTGRAAGTCPDGGRSRESMLPPIRCMTPGTSGVVFP